MKYDEISLNTFKMYMNSLTRLIEQKISKLLTNRLALVVDGQTTPNANYVTVFVSFSDGERHCTVCLALSFMEDKTTQDALEHIGSIEFSLSVFSKCFSNVVTFMEKNYAINR